MPLRGFLPVSSKPDAILPKRSTYFSGILLFARLPAVGIPLVFLATFASSFYFFKRGILRRF